MARGLKIGSRGDIERLLGQLGVFRAVLGRLGLFRFFLGGPFILRSGSKVLFSGSQLLRRLFNIWCSLWSNRAPVGGQKVSGPGLLGAWTGFMGKLGGSGRTMPNGGPLG